MTLIEKFHLWLKTEPNGNRYRPATREYQCAIIAEDFAIEFGEWLREECYDVGEHEWIYLEDNEHYTTKQILEIFKKEKEL